MRALRWLGRSRHQFISWAASGADDTSPCCEQFNLLRIAPSIQPFAYRKLDGRMRGQFHWRPDYPARAGESKGFLGICSTKCSRCNTASLSCDIMAYADSRNIHSGLFRCRAAPLQRPPDRDRLPARPNRRRNYVGDPARQAAVHREPVRAAIQRFDRIEIADLGLQPWRCPPFAHREDLQPAYGRGRQRFQGRPPAAKRRAAPGRGGRR